MSNHQMTLALNASGSLTMSSVEIAKLTRKTHNHVIRDIRVMLEALGDATKFGSIYRDAMNREKPCFNLPKRECLILVSGYSVELRAAIIDRWQELEAQAVAEEPVKVPQTLAQALRLAADQAERVSA